MFPADRQTGQVGRDTELAEPALQTGEVGTIAEAAEPPLPGIASAAEAAALFAVILGGRLLGRHVDQRLCLCRTTLGN